MSNEGVSIRNLEGPFIRHLYIGFAPANKNIVLDLRAKLEKQGVICYLRALHGNLEASIQEGVGISQKCLLFLTSDYLTDDQYEKETLAVVEKSKRFCHDMVIILKSDDLEVIPERLRKFTLRQFKPENLNDEKYMATFVDMITREPILDLAVEAKHIAGYESARNYFYGFLRFVLKDFKKRLIEETLKNEPEDVQKTVQKMLIIIPESCFCPTNLEWSPESAANSESPCKIEFTGKFVVRVAHRAGNHKCDYKSSLFKMIDREKQEYYFVGEFATPLLTMFDAYSHDLCGMTKDQLYDERDGFCIVLKAFLSHLANAEFNNQFKLLYWSDPATEKANRLDLYNFLLPVLRKEITEQQNYRNPPEMATNPTVGLRSANRVLCNTFEPVHVDGCNPARIYDDNGNYPMDHRPRGICLIVNIANFDKCSRLEPRQGAEKDEERIKKLFEDLHFKVQLEKDVDEQTLKCQLLKIQNTVHTNYDAFVCCIMTHGKLGVIYTRDGNEVEILSLVEFFTDRNCPSLKGKPKMFFIQACQKGSPEPENGAAGNSLPHDGSTGDRLAIPSSPSMASDSVVNMESLPLSTRETVECVSEGICSIQSAISDIAVAEVELEIKEDAVADPTEHRAVLVPGFPDFLMSYSTLPGSVSYRYPQTGSPYIQALDECFRRHRDSEIDRVLKQVNSSVREKLEQLKQDGVQFPFHLTSGMERLIYL